MNPTTNIQCHPVPVQWLEVETGRTVLFAVLIGGEQGEAIGGEGGEDEGIGQE